MAQNLSLFVRHEADAASLETVAFSELISHIQADTINLLQDNNGEYFLHIKNSASKERFSIKISSKADWDEENQDIEGLVNDNVIYLGINKVTKADGTIENRPWFRYSRKPLPNEPVRSISVAALLAKTASASHAGVPA